MATAFNTPTSYFLADQPPTVVKLAIKPHFDALSTKEKTYAHHLSVASLAGTRIVFRQISPESEDIYDFIIALHKHCDGDWKKLQSEAGVSDDDLTAFLNYSAQFMGNSGNFKSFGDSKFVPRISPDNLCALAKPSAEATALLKKIGDAFYIAPTEEEMYLGYPDGGHVSTYYPDSKDITKEEITIVSDFLESKKLLPENTRLRETADGFDVLIASAEKSPKKEDRDVDVSEWTIPDGKLKGKVVRLVYGDHHVEMEKIACALAAAKEVALNDTQDKMHGFYVKAFKTGSLLAYKDSQRQWIRDKGPSVECDIGFVETYRDPHGQKGEWEGFAAMVNKERTRAFGKLVQAAPSFIPKLPWDRLFEKDKFLAPDFTSLEVLTFAGSGIPAGINIPNYDDIRQTEGFKNVSLGNVLNAKGPKEKIPFIRDEDMELFHKYADPGFEIQVGLHELLGHGCGKLLQETSPGQYNFDIKNPPISPITEKPITTWYKPGQTWGSVFGPIAASYEECRAECVAMVLSCDFKVLEIFGFGDGNVDMNGEASDVLYASYLTMARAGVAALEMWDPKSRKWGQAHMQARFSIFKTFLSAGPEFCRLEHSADDLSDLKIHLDKSKIISHGRPAVEKYLQKLHIYKSTGDVENGTRMYNDITSVDEFFATKVRPAVLANKKPRKVFVQANTFLKDDGSVELREYEPTPEGLIQSFAERTYI